MWLRVPAKVGSWQKLIHLSKSKFTAGVQCLKRLYWQIHQPDLAEPFDVCQDALLEQGHDVGLLAQDRFPGGVLVEWNNMEDALANTAKLIKTPTVRAIFEATFRHHGVVVRVDILERRPQNRWRLIEVKSSFEAKAHYLYDLAIQNYVLKACGLDLSSVNLMLLNRDYC